MRKVKTLFKAPFSAPDVVTKGISAPTDGLDAISPLADMDPKRAPILTNWVPRPGWVELRAGFQPWTQFVTSLPVETLMAYRAPTGEKLHAASGGKIFDVSTRGGASVLASGFLSSRWQYTNFQVPGGSHYIILGNGVDDAQIYNGSSYSNWSISGLPGGITTADIVNIYATKQRLWLVLVNSSVVAYMPTDAITGPIAGTQDLGDTWTKGGSLIAVVDWTIDGGEGPSSYVAFISSEGEVTLYQGTDPTNANAWSLVGTFALSPPIGYRCATRIGSDVGLITYAGLIPLSQALPYDPSADRSASLTSRIQNAMNQAVQSSSQNFGWQFITYPAQTLGLLNVPATENASQFQFAMNMLTGAWCQFQGWNANCFELYNQQLLFGDNAGNINLAYVGQTDWTSGLSATMQCAFNWFDDPGRLKRMTMLQPLMTTDGTATPSLSVDVDFATSAPSAPVTTSVSGGVWDSSLWDQDLWSSGITQFTSFLSVEAIGKALAVSMQVSLGASSSVSVFDVAEFDEATFDDYGPSQSVLQLNAWNAIMELGGFI
jgi:hypothetical protein